MDVIRPLYSVGDFVCCDYSSIIVFSYHDDDISSAFYYGIVIEVDYAYYDFMDEYVYEVLCLDGQKRYFMETELSRM
tara:strand:- start:94 stop:324 length:231 start_codon:yes stop_codon:yes gene_type:complete